MSKIDSHDAIIELGKATDLCGQMEHLHEDVLSQLVSAFSQSNETLGQLSNFLRSSTAGFTVAVAMQPDSIDELDTRLLADPNILDMALNYAVQFCKHGEWVSIILCEQVSQAWRYRYSDTMTIPSSTDCLHYITDKPHLIIVIMTLLYPRATAGTIAEIDRAIHGQKQ